MIIEYLTQFHLQDCFNILSERDNLGYFSVKIDFLKLFEAFPAVGDKVLCSPVESLPACDRDIIKFQQNILEQEEYKSQLNNLDYSYLKRNVHARFFGLPVCPELHRTIFPKNVDIHCFLKVTGTVVRVTQSKMLEFQRKYVCTKCKYENVVQADFENRYILKAPRKCSNEQTKCRCMTFSQVNLVSREHCKDYQEVKIQEQVNKLNVGTIPASMWVVLENDLVDCCKPGDDVYVCGTVRRRWRPAVQAKQYEVELVLQANYVEVCNSQRSELVSSAPDIKQCFDEFWNNYDECPLRGRDQILAAICPQVYGLYLVKLALLLTVITGSNHIVETESNKDQEETHSDHVRGQCHLLLVGDPGTGKSQLLQSGAELTARSVFTSGAGSTRAGLTCAAMREEGEWQLEAGALVLSDGGVCCIDEVSLLRGHDRAAVHEAMEQQTISVAKAGIVCKLNTRCAVIAACNPKGNYDTNQPLSVNVSLGTPLLSRFDLIFILLDTKNKMWDNLVSSYILFGGSTTDVKKQWNIEKLQMYISLVGPRRTKMTKSANIILRSYYMIQRKSENRDPSRTTVRMLDSLVRLSQAHCRLMYRTTIFPIDAIVAVTLVDLSMQDCTLVNTVDALHSTIPKYPDFEYLCTAKKLLTRLNLYEIWREELLRYGKLLKTDHKTLESDIDNKNCHLFTKYDNLADENIPLSASLVTSSYFKNINKTAVSKDTEDANVEVEIEKNHVSNKLAETLKKHANLNKKEKNPPKLPSKKIKRKRKEVTAKIDHLNLNIKNNRAKKTKRSIPDLDKLSDSNSEDENNVLDAVPSVNDFFKDLGIDFKVHTMVEEENDSTLNKIHTKDKTKYVIGDNLEEGQHIGEVLNSTNGRKDSNCKSENLNSSRISNKLKMFQCDNKVDCDKFIGEKSVKSEDAIVKLESEKKNESSNNISFKSQKTSLPSSQISMFESSDCEIDLDI